MPLWSAAHISSVILWPRCSSPSPLSVPGITLFTRLRRCSGMMFVPIRIPWRGSLRTHLRSLILMRQRLRSRILRLNLARIISYTRSRIRLFRMLAFFSLILTSRSTTSLTLSISKQPTTQTLLSAISWHFLDWFQSILILVCRKPKSGS